MVLSPVLVILWFPVLFLVHWACEGKAGPQNLVLLGANLGFYAYWDSRCLGLLIVSTLLNYLLARAICTAERPERRRSLLAVSLASDLGFLGAFKYADFFSSSLVQFLGSLGVQVDIPTLRLVLPVGISFLTLQRVSYTLDVYRRHVPAFRGWLSFCCAMTFFPLIISGPIERPRRLVPQFNAPRRFDPTAAGGALRQILWGLFKKRVIADSLAPVVASAFGEPGQYTGIELAGAAFVFAVQVYADFSGYSDIAIGSAKLVGIRVRKNFSYPYFSKDIGEFWRRWHISLSGWLRDYIYTPLAWRVPVTAKWRRVACILATFTACGLWHGASWTFVVWGILNGVYFIPLVLRETRGNDGRLSASALWGATRLIDAVRMVTTFALTCLAWIVFRADSLGHAAQYVTQMCLGSWFVVPRFRQALLTSCVLLAMEWMQRDRDHVLDVGHLPVQTRWAAYVVVALALLLLPHPGGSAFIYMRF